MIEKIIIIALLFFQAKASYAQQLLQLNATFVNDNFELNKKYTLLNGDTVVIDQCKFYLTFLKQNKEKTVLLINLSEPASKQFQFNEKINQIFFGVDSLQNVSPNFEAALDPIFGMYWTWQSGFINLKLEGFILQKGSPAKHFQYHIGGFENGLNTFLPLLLMEDLTSKSTLQISFDSFLNQINYDKLNIMSPQADAVQMAKAFANAIK